MVARLSCFRSAGTFFCAGLEFFSAQDWSSAVAVTHVNGRSGNGFCRNSTFSEQRRAEGVGLDVCEWSVGVQFLQFTESAGRTVKRRKIIILKEDVDFSDR